MLVIVQIWLCQCPADSFWVSQCSRVKPTFFTMICLVLAYLPGLISHLRRCTICPSLTELLPFPEGTALWASSTAAQLLVLSLSAAAQIALTREAFPALWDFSVPCVDALPTTLALYTCFPYDSITCLIVYFIHSILFPEHQVCPVDSFYPQPSS